MGFPPPSSRPVLTFSLAPLIPLLIPLFILTWLLSPLLQSSVAFVFLGPLALGFLFSSLPRSPPSFYIAPLSACHAHAVYNTTGLRVGLCVKVYTTPRRMWLLCTAVASVCTFNLCGKGVRGLLELLHGVRYGKGSPAVSHPVVLAAPPSPGLSFSALSPRRLPLSAVGAVGRCCWSCC